MNSHTLSDLRNGYHRKILRQILGHRADSEVFSNADSGSKVSKELAARLAIKLSAQTGVKPCRDLPTSQSIGTKFTNFTKEFLDEAFTRLQHLRPGEWVFSTSQGGLGIARYYQYEHLATLSEVLESHPELKSALGGDYLVTPDIIIAREPVPDDKINKGGVLVNSSMELAKYAPLRKSVNPTSILHASISCKWTLRSDRSQNTRTEALNLIRGRKGKVPIIAAVTFEPMPTRIASIAMGTGDLDCTYHAALPELLEAVEEIQNESQEDMLKTLVDGRRLRDISDLPLDLAT